jgi:opacity protein-like surface antigen
MSVWQAAGARAPRRRSGVASATPERAMQPFRRWILAAVASGALPLAAHADDVFLVYAGGGIGQSQIKVDALGARGHDTAWKILAGVRAVDFLGAEAAYVDLGRPRSTSTSGQVNSRASGPVVFGVAYLPLAIPYLDVYAKAGVANIQQRTTVTLSSGANACVPGVGCDGFNRSESEFAWGGGAQLKTGSIAIRVEYEQFRASGGDLGIGSVAFLWNFL